MKLWAQENVPRVDVREQTKRFVDYWRSLPGQRGVRIDWTATWRNWMRKAGDDAPLRPSSYAERTAVALHPDGRGAERLQAALLVGSGKASLTEEEDRVALHA
jgi:hypothetical protein